MTLLLVLAQAATPIEGTPSKPDANGAYTVKLEIPDQPVSVAKGDEWEGAFIYRLPGDVTIRRVRSFVGVDRLNIWEGHLLVLAEDYYLATRSPHKERVGEYDAWEAEKADYRVPPEGADLYMFGLCRPTSPKAVKCEFGVVLELAP